MKFRGLAAAALVLIALGAVLYWSEHHKPAESTAPAAATPAIVQIDPATVTNVTIRIKGSEPVVLTKSGDRWQITAPTAAPADGDAVSALLATLHPLSSVRVIEDKATGLAQYGLNGPAAEVDVEAKGKTTRLMLGDSTPTGDALYATVAGDPRVFTAGAATRASLAKNEDDLRDKRLVRADAQGVSQIQLSHNGTTMIFGRTKDGWQMQKPEAYRTDGYQVDDLLQQVTGAKWDPAVPARAAEAAWGHAQPLATVKVTDKAGAVTLEVRKDKEDYYAKSSDVPEVCKVDAASALAAALSRGVDEYRNRQLFDFGYSDPDRIDYHAGTTTLTLEHRGNDWIAGGKKIDEGSAEAVVAALRGLSAGRFADSGLNSPNIRITVTSNAGKRVEKAEMQQTGSGAIAKRDDGPSLYVLDEAAVKTLTSAVAGVKPAAGRASK